MKEQTEYHFGEATTVFRELRLPEPATPVGYAALINALDLNVPLPRALCAIGTRSKMLEQDGWRIFPPRYAPSGTLGGHITFALKYEGVDLAVLKRIFEACPPNEIANIVSEHPSGGYARRTWFLYEWLMGRLLDLPDTKGAGRYVSAIDTNLQYATTGKPSARHRVRNNLPGTRSFCPLVFRTKPLETFIARDFAARAQKQVDSVPADLLARAAAFLLLKDSRSSFAIEGQRPPQDRIQRWGRAIGGAGKKPIDLDELLRLQRIVIGDERFVKLGLRTEGGFVGDHDRRTGEPLPEHIDARFDDLRSLIDGMIAFDRGAARDLDPVLAAAVLAFGFVYTHPFEDGNGRIHRFLMHHVLAARGFTPAGIVFPISSVIHERVAEYEKVLQTYSARLLPVVEWKPTPKGNVEVLNETADFYRFFDATPHVEFLFKCVEHTIEIELPRETAFLKAYDTFAERVQRIVDMPDRTANLLFRFLTQNAGRLSARARKGEFAALKDAEVIQIEEAYRTTIGSLSYSRDEDDSVELADIESG